MIWQPCTTQNTAELTLGNSHDIRVPGHREEKATQGGIGLEGSEHNQVAGAATTHTVSDIPTRNGQKEGNGRREHTTYRHTQRLQYCK
jgi:hypothetical protein